MFFISFLKPKNLSFDRAEFFSIFVRKVTALKEKEKKLAKFSLNTQRLGSGIWVTLEFGSDGSKLGSYTHTWGI